MSYEFSDGNVEPSTASMVPLVQRSRREEFWFLWQDIGGLGVIFAPYLSVVCALLVGRWYWTDGGWPVIAWSSLLSLLFVLPVKAGITAFVIVVAFFVLQTFLEIVLDILFDDPWDMGYE